MIINNRQGTIFPRTRFQPIRPVVGTTTRQCLAKHPKFLGIYFHQQVLSIPETAPAPDCIWIISHTELEHVNHQTKVMSGKSIFVQPTVSFKLTNHALSIHVYQRIWLITITLCRKKRRNHPETLTHSCLLTRIIGSRILISDSCSQLITTFYHRPFIRIDSTVRAINQQSNILTILSNWSTGKTREYRVRSTSFLSHQNEAITIIHDTINIIHLIHQWQYFFSR